MAPHDVKRLPDGYEWVDSAGTTQLRFRPLTAGEGAFRVVSIADITTEFSTESVPEPTALAVAKLNARAVSGAYFLENQRLVMRAQYTVYEEEPAFELAARLILGTFGAQMPLGYSTYLASKSSELLRQERAHQQCPRSWQSPFDIQAFESAAEHLCERGIYSTASEHGIIAEVALSGDCPSVLIEPSAHTALLHVHTNVPHPIAGAGYLATIALPVNPSPENMILCCERLNTLEQQEVDFVPRLGAWGVRGVGDDLVYSQFLPMNHVFGEMHSTIMWWLVIRARWLRSLGWEPGKGLAFQSHIDEARAA